MKLSIQDLSFEYIHIYVYEEDIHSKKQFLHSTHIFYTHSCPVTIIYKYSHANIFQQYRILIITDENKTQNYLHQYPVKAIHKPRKKRNTSIFIFQIWILIRVKRMDWNQSTVLKSLDLPLGLFIE